LKERACVIACAQETAFVLSLLVEICERQEKRGQALEHLEELKSLTAQVNQDWARAIYSQAAGFMASEMEDWETAFIEYEEAAKDWKALAFPYELAKAYRSLGVVHLNLGRIETANRLLESARQIFEKLGAKLDVEKTKTEITAIDDPSAFVTLRLRGGAKESSKSIFDFLVSAFIADYHSNRYAGEASGWRSFAEIARHTKMPISTFYGHGKSDGGGLTELERMGLVETRVFLGERGRGGKTTRSRIAYDHEEVKKYVSRKVEKTSRKIGR